jgi:hypothetical protein
MNLQLQGEVLQTSLQLQWKVVANEIITAIMVAA